LDAFVPWMTHDKIFSTHFYSAGPPRGQGWKLHVSATPWSAPEVLERLLPALLARGVSFKVASTSQQLLLLNNGIYGASQVGKFVTAYPHDDTQAVSLAWELDDLTDGLRGPRVPSDRPLRLLSLVHYRYGPFASKLGRPPSEPTDAIGSLRDGLGRWVSDPRALSAPLPDAANNPFADAALSEGSTGGESLLAGRFVVVDVLATSATGGIYRAVDIESSPARVCVLKEFWRDAGGDISGRLAPDWGRREAGLLSSRSGEPGFPTFIDCFERDQNVYVAIEFIPGSTIAADLEARADRQEGFAVHETVQVGLDTATALERIHQHGVVVRDVNPSNLVFSSEGCRLVDFGIAYDTLNDAEPPSHGLGTADFCSPQQWAGHPPNWKDDIFSWGAVMHTMLGGDQALEASVNLRSPSEPVARRPIRSLRPQVPEDLGNLVDRAVAWDQQDRFSSFTEILDVLRPIAARCSSSRGLWQRDHARRIEPDAGEQPDPLAVARAVGDRLVSSAILRDGGACWPTTGAGGAFCSPDIYHGAAGVSIFLAELGTASGDARYLESARAGARWVSGSVWAHGRGEQGLYCGESGVGLLFIRLAALFEEPAFLVAAELRARRIRDLRGGPAELLGGSAGHVVFLVRLAQATASAGYLAEAGDIVTQLVSSPVQLGNGGPPWKLGADRIPKGTPLGLSHGAAGVGQALLTFANASGESTAADSAVALGGLLLELADLHPEGSCTWPETAHGEHQRVQAQCHGAIGIGQFLLRLSKGKPGPFAEAASGAALTARREMSRRSASCLCHGVAGDGVFLLECSRALDDQRYAEWAATAQSLLVGHRTRGEAGSYGNHGLSDTRPELLTGDAGVGWFHLAMSQPQVAADPVLGPVQAPRRPDPIRSDRGR
jgi:hypothetical protein